MGWLAKSLAFCFRRGKLFPKLYGRGNKNPAVDEYLKSDPFYINSWGRPHTLKSLIEAME